MCPTPPLEVRLRRRYLHLVAESLSPADAVAAGVRALPGRGTAFAQTQAAYRFFSNPDVTLTALAAPLRACSQQMAAELDRFALVVIDWSPLTYPAHTRKPDRIHLNPFTLGYEMQTALLVSDRDGMVLSVLAASLWTSDGLWTTRSDALRAAPAHMDEAGEMMRQIDGFDLGASRVYIIDREGDSVAHLRAWHEADRRFLVRANSTPTVVWGGRQMALGQVARCLDLRPAHAIDVSSGVIAQQFVAHTRVTITRAARPRRQRGGVKQPRKQVKGTPLEVRLIVSEVRTPDEKVIARWLLLTNVEEEDSEKIAQWYAWRWRTESFYKLLKTAGLHMEQWQQETGERILKRALVGAMATTVVWQLARASGEEAAEARGLLVRLSGRQMRRERPHTEPAMMAGMWVLLAALDALEHYSLSELRRIARFATLGIVRYDTS